jgi:hypothetical protein
MSRSSQGQDGSVAPTGGPVSVAVQRPALPLLWLDTSILIGASRRERGAAKGIDPRVGDLIDAVQEKLGAGKLLCLESDQVSEVEGHPSAEEIRLALRRLTWGVRALTAPEVEGEQVFRAMRAYLKGSAHIALPWSSFLELDPGVRSAAVQKDGWFITASHDMPDDERQEARRAKLAKLSDLEELRQKNMAAGRRFSEQLEIEQRGTWDTLVSLHGRFLAEYYSPNPDWLRISAGSPLLDALEQWRSLGGIPSDLPKFFASEHFLSLPHNHIRDRLLAEILTAPRPVSKSDSMDVSHMSVALPIATWIVTEKSLAHRVRQLKLDAHWGAEVYSLRTVQHLLETLTGL